MLSQHVFWPYIHILYIKTNKQKEIGLHALTISSVIWQKKMAPFLHTRSGE